MFNIFRKCFATLDIKTLSCFLIVAVKISAEMFAQRNFRFMATMISIRNNKSDDD